MKNNFILAISGNDIFSGGGLHADLATYTVNQLHGFVAVTCLTAMTEQGFEVIPVDTTVFAQQLNSLKDVPFSAIKLGLLPNVEVADLALDFVKAHAETPVVLDPVLVCKESHDVEVSALRDELIKFFLIQTLSRLIYQKLNSWLKKSCEHWRMSKKQLDISILWGLNPLLSKEEIA